ncbi:MAG: hypothetical protein ACRYGG_19125 [Janthinobacterium lividum]
MSKEAVQIALLEQRAQAMEERINVLTSEIFASKIMWESVVPILLSQDAGTRAALLAAIRLNEDNLHLQISLWKQDDHNHALMATVKRVRDYREKLAEASPPAGLQRPRK